MQGTKGQCQCAANRPALPGRGHARAHQLTSKAGSGGSPMPHGIKPKERGKRELRLLTDWQPTETMQPTAAVYFGAQGERKEWLRPSSFSQ